MSNIYTYRYSGPAAYHSLVGQIMASLGFVGGHRPAPTGAAVLLREENRRFFLQCTYGNGHTAQHFSATVKGPDIPRQVKRELLHWYDQWQGKTRGPWGILTGVRPTKLVHRLWDQGHSEETIENILQEEYEVAKETARFLVNMARLQRPYVAVQPKCAALYIGIPYCSGHCLYCSFPSRQVTHEPVSRLSRFAEALVKDVEDWAALCAQYDLQVQSIYIGGGTPTCLSVQFLQPLLQVVQQHFSSAGEWTVEAGRPDTATLEKLTLLRRCGVNRISVNPQTMQQSLLDRLGRNHRVEDIYDMYEHCRQLGFPVINMDFIAGLPQQTVVDMEENMKIVCQLQAENVTIHTLALKKSAPLFQHPLRQYIPEAATVEKMLAICRQYLRHNGYIPYYMYRQKYMATNFANIGYARPGTISTYNIEMMEERQTVLAAGPGGATKFLTGPYSLAKLYEPKDIDAYIQALPDKIQERHRMCARIYGGEDT